MRRQVANFLREFRTKLGIWGIIYLDDRKKNTQTLADLELRPQERRKILENLQEDDYSQGPLAEDFYGGQEMWVFGRMVKGFEIYIKISLGRPQTNVICISFHVAEHPMSYPIKQGKKASGEDKI